MSLVNSTDLKVPEAPSVSAPPAAPTDTVNKLYFSNSGGGGHLETVKFKIAKDKKNPPTRAVREAEKVQKKAQETLRIAELEAQTHPDSANFQAVEKANTTLEQANSALERAREKAKTCKFNPLEIDALKVLGSWFGIKNGEGWNKAKKAGDIPKQEKLVKMQWIAEVIYFIPMFIKTLHTIFKYDIHEIFDAQVLGTKAILLAARVANCFKRFKDHPIQVTKQMTDLAHKDSEHFFKAIRSLNEKDRKIFTLVVPNLPILIEEKDEFGNLLTEEAFWKKHTGLDMTQIVKGELPVRQAFKDWKNKHPIKDRPVNGFSVKVSDIEEIKNLKAVLGINHLDINIDPETQKCTVKIPFADLPENEVVILESVGSQVPREAILADIKVAIKNAGQNPETPYSMYVPCGKDVPDGLYREVVELLKRKRASGEIPTNLKIIPMTYQDDTELAPLVCCSNYLNQGAGGLTCFESFECLYKDEKDLSPAANAQRELLANGKVMVRSVAKKPKSKTGSPQRSLTQDELLNNGFSVWEKGNARTLKAFLNALFSDADVFAKHVFAKKLPVRGERGSLNRSQFHEFSCKPLLPSNAESLRTVLPS